MASDDKSKPAEPETKALVTEPPTPTDEQLLDGAVAWKMCRERLEKGTPSDRSLIDWVVRLKAREKGTEFDDPLRHFWATLPEVEVPTAPTAPQDLEAGDYGICSRRMTEVYQDPHCTEPLMASLYFGDLYQVMLGGIPGKSVHISLISERVQGFLPFAIHLPISPGEYRVLNGSPRDVRLTFLVKLLSEKK